MLWKEAWEVLRVERKIYAPLASLYDSRSIRRKDCAEGFQALFDYLRICGVEGDADPPHPLGGGTDVSVPQVEAEQVRIAVIREGVEVVLSAASIDVSRRPELCLTSPPVADRSSRYARALGDRGIDQPRGTQSHRLIEFSSATHLL
jgi:hypothetical protein